jgi:dCMP deaminase
MKKKWIDAYMDTAERFAQLSSAVKLKVGSVVVKDNRIISIGYNGTPAGWDNNCENVVSLPSWAKSIDDVAECDRQIYVEYKTKDEVIHAEANAISKLARDSEGGDGADLFCTHAPCIHCAKLIYGAGIKKVYYKNTYRSEEGLKFLEQCNVETQKV